MIKPYYSYTDILSKISEEELAYRYIPNYPGLNKSFATRVDDTKASTRVRWHNGHLYVKDFGNNKKAISVLEFIQQQYNKSYDEVLDMIISDFKSDLKTRKLVTKKSRSCNNTPTIIKVKYRAWNDADSAYWGQYGITIQMLENANIFPIKYCWLTNNKYSDKRFNVAPLAYSYNYYLLDGVFRRKIYQPHNKSCKWLSNCNITVVQNYTSLPKEGDLLIIQSSHKDALVMNTMGYYSISPITESSWFTNDYWGKISQRFTEIVYFANNDWEKSDNSGLKFAEGIKRDYGINYIYTPDIQNVTDISDYRALLGYNNTKELVDYLLMDYINNYE